LALREHIPGWTRKWAGDTGLLLISQAQVTIVTTLLAVVLARSLGPADWGIFSTFIGLSQGASLLVDIGLNNYLLREVSRVWARDERVPRRELAMESARIMRLCLPVNVSFGSLLVVAFGLGALVVGLSLTLSALLAALMAYVVLVGLAAGLETTLRAQRRTWLILGGVLLDKVVLLAGVGVTLYADLGFTGLGLSHVLAGVCHVLFAYAFTLLPLPRPKERPPLRESLGMVRLSFPFAFNFAALNVIPRFDLAIVAAFSTVDASYYSIGERIIFAIIIVPTVAGMALYPFLAREESAARSAVRAGSIMALAGAAFAVAGAALAPTLIPALFGDDYDDSIRITQIMLIALPFMFASNALIPGLYTSGRERRLFAMTAPGAVLGSAGVLVGQLLFGVVGAATAFVARQVYFAVVLLALSTSRRLPAASERPAPEPAGST
jgi:O-antigen/teichoic acid export membrane protein